MLSIIGDERREGNNSKNPSAEFFESILRRQTPILTHVLTAPRKTFIDRIGQEADVRVLIEKVCLGANSRHSGMSPRLGFVEVSCA